MTSATGTSLIVPLPCIAKAQQMDGQRRVYFETSREGVIDREGEDIAAQALWASRDLFLQQGNLDINHFSWLGNPYGTGARPEYVIGLPREVKRQGKSIYVAGEIFSNRTPPPEGSSGHWADWFWHSIAEMEPRQRWFPSVFGNIRPGGVRVEKRNGRTIRFITAVEWYSVGFAQRAQHPALPPVSLEPLGPLAKAASFDHQAARRAGALVMDLQTFAKAISAVGAPVTDSALKVGPQALAPQSLEGYTAHKNHIVRRILTGQLPPKRRAIVQALCALGIDKKTAQRWADRLLIEAAQTLRRKGDGPRI